MHPSPVCSLLCLSLALLWGSINVSAQSDPVFPTIPSSYSCYVSANFNDKNYTLAYKETFDATLNVLRTEGRFGDWNTVDVINFNTRVLNRFNSTSCDRFENIGGPDTRELTHSLSFFNSSFSRGTKTYIGQRIARNVRCNVWEMRSVFPTANISVDYYFDAVRNVPMRVVLKGTRVDPVTQTARSYFHNYDWINVEVQSFPNLAQLPSLCTNAPLQSNLSLFRRFSSEMAPMPTTAKPTPLLPTQFSTVVEAKLASVTSESSEPSLAGYQWSVDTASPNGELERVDCLSRCPNDVTTYLTTYDRPSQSVTQYVVYSSGSCTRNTYSLASSAPLLSYSPLRNIRAGSVPSIMTNAQSSSRTFSGRTERRGVPADSFDVSSVQSSNQGAQFTFNSSFLFFPQGWAFPGRPSEWLQNSSQGVPLGVVNQGSFVTSASPVLQAYVDYWDFYLFIAGPPTQRAANLFDPSQFGCPFAPQSGTEDPSGPSAGVVVFIVLLVVAVAAVAGFGFYKWRQKHQYAFSDTANVTNVNSSSSRVQHVQMDDE